MVGEPLLSEFMVRHTFKLYRHRIIDLYLKNILSKEAFMLCRKVRSKYRASLYSIYCMSFIWILLLGMALMGCRSSPESTFSAATTIEEPRATVTQSSATLTAPVTTDNTATVAMEIEKVVKEKRPFQITILHTNDTLGEVEPCG